VLAGLAPDATQLEARVERARKGIDATPSIQMIYCQDSFVLPTSRSNIKIAINS